MKNYEQEQQMVQHAVHEVHEPEPEVLGFPEWWWTGIFVPVVIAWIVHRRYKRKHDGDS